MMLYDVISRLRERTDAVIVGVSRGKDSLACLDLCVSLFPRVEAFHMHLVPGLSFVENYLGYLERRYSITIDRVPHWWLSHAFRHGSFRPLTRSCPRVTIRDVQVAQRKRTGIEWIVSGEKACDSLQRRGMISNRGALDEKVKVAYPLAHWNDRAVYEHLKRERVPLPPDYRLLGRSFSTQLDGRTLTLIREHYPDDFDRVREVFPFVEAALARRRSEAAEESRLAGEAQEKRRGEEAEKRARAAAERAERRARRRLAATQKAGLPGGARRKVAAQPGPVQPPDDRPAQQETPA